MQIRGRIKNGVVILEGRPSLPEGAEVTVLFVDPSTAEKPKVRVKFPLVRSKLPGSVRLTADRVAELLEEDDER
ncbi:MAG TPA: hypothetical protein VMV10_07730 [Pirellulales bacterium]|nr:hypothetical protein [Pirellulales bacterium]